jgi:hypothetical protein
VRRFVLILICALMAFSHGGLVAAHSHHDGISAHHDDDSARHVIGDVADHDGDHDADATDHDDHGSAAVDDDSDRPSSNPSTIAHSHINVDASATPPVLASVRVVTLRFEPPLRRDALPPSATVAPGLEPPDA